nr:roadblock/LC7 domain-containing protein [Streptomyces sp. EAS-AB2608]
MTPETAKAASDQGAAANVQQNLAWLLRQFVADVPGALHAVLLSREGLRLLDSDVDKDWADELSAAISGMASIAANVTGPTHQKKPAKQVMVERDDCLLLVQSAGGSAAFKNQPGAVRGVVDTILVVVTDPDADVGAAGFEMSRLVDKFAPYMEVPVRVASGDEAR